MAKYDIDQVLDALNQHKIRATYSAVASLLGTHPKMLAGQYLGNRRPRASWVVSKATGMPTDYLPANCHAQLQRRSHIIEDPSELIELVEKGDGWTTEN